MADFTVRADHIDVEQIMRQIRARIRDKRGADYTEEEIRELAAVKLEKFLDPRAVRSDLLQHYRRQHQPTPLIMPEEAHPPLYDFTPTTVYVSDRGVAGKILTVIRKILKPISKLFFHVDTVWDVLSKQAVINAQHTRLFQRAHQRFITRDELDSLNFEMFNNLVVELTRLGIEVKNLRMQVESFGTRLDFDERRARALEGVVQYRPGAAVARPPQSHQQPAGAGAGAVAGVGGAAGAGTGAGDEGDEEDATPGAEGGAGDLSRSARRRRRRRGRRRGGQAGAMGAGQGPGGAEGEDGESDGEEVGRQESRWQPRGGSSVAPSAGADEDAHDAAASQQASEHAWQPRSDSSASVESSEHAVAEEAPTPHAWPEAQASEAAPAYERDAHLTPPAPASEPAEPSEPQRVFHRVFDRPRDEQADHDHSSSEHHEPSSPAHDRSDRSDDREPSQS